MEQTNSVFYWIFCGNKSFMVFQSSQKCGFKIVNNNFFYSLFRRWIWSEIKDNNSARYEQERVEEEIADFLTVGK